MGLYNYPQLGDISFFSESKCVQTTSSPGSSLPPPQLPPPKKTKQNPKQNNNKQTQAMILFKDVQLMLNVRPATWLFMRLDYGP